MRIASRSSGLITILGTVSCFSPLQLAGGPSISRKAVRPRAEATLALQDTIWTDPGRHQALWLGATGSVAATPAGFETFLGAEVQFSRVRNARSPEREVELYWLRPEVGYVGTEDDPTFVGGSVGIMRVLGHLPLTFSLRLGRNVHGPEAGPTAAISCGVVLGSPLYWMH
jgi:hypothetical protein